MSAKWKALFFGAAILCFLGAVIVANGDTRLRLTAAGALLAWATFFADAVEAWDA